MTVAANEEAHQMGHNNLANTLVASQAQSHLQLEGWAKNPKSPSLPQADKEANFLEMLTLGVPTVQYEN